MALDTLTLGPFVFEDMAVPGNMPFGGKHQLVTHKMPGGARTIDAMGPDDDDRSWSGILWGDTAADDMALLDALRVQGAKLGFNWGAESRLCVISDFKATVERWTCIHYTITVTLSDTPGASAGGSVQSLAGMVLSDLTSALGV